MHRLRIVVLALVAGVLAACSGLASSGISSPSGGASPTVVAVTMTDALRFEPDAFSFSAGETVRFGVTNSGVMRHEFFIGDENAQSDHEAEMMQMGGMTHDEADGIFVDPGESKVLEHTFGAAGTLVIGCHELGHYAAGMMASVTVGE